MSTIALPLVAIDRLGASAFQVALISTMLTLPYLLAALHVGVLVDSFPRRRILIGADLARGAALAVIPLTYFSGLLSLTVIYAVAFVVGLGTVVFEIGYRSYLPSLVSRQQLMDANGKLTATTSGLAVAGYSGAGLLIEALGNVFALAVNMTTYLISFFLLVSMRDQEGPVRHHERWGKGAVSGVASGLQIVIRNPILRSIACATAVANLSYITLLSTLTLYMTRALDMSAVEVGIVFASGGVGVFMGSLVVKTLVDRLGIGSTLFTASLISAGGLSLIAAAPLKGAVFILMSGYAVYSLGLPLFNVPQLSLRQAVFPDHLQGRINATMRFIGAGVMPIGAAASGALATATGSLRFSITISAIMGLLAALIVLISPLRAMRTDPVV